MGVIGVVDVLIPSRAFRAVPDEIFCRIPIQQLSADVAPTGVVVGFHEDGFGVIPGARLDDAESQLMAGGVGTILAGFLPARVFLFGLGAFRNLGDIEVFHDDRFAGSGDGLSSIAIEVEASPQGLLPVAGEPLEEMEPAAAPVPGRGEHVIVAGESVIVPVADEVSETMG